MSGIENCLSTYDSWPIDGESNSYMELLIQTYYKFIRLDPNHQISDKKIIG